MFGRDCLTPSSFIQLLQIMVAKNWNLNCQWTTSSLYFRFLKEQDIGRMKKKLYITTKKNIETLPPILSFTCE